MKQTQWVAMGGRIAQARRRLGLLVELDINPTVFAALMGVEPISVYRWEAGDRAPSRANLQTISSKCAVSLDWLTEGRGLMELDPAPKGVATRGEVVGAVEQRASQVEEKKKGRGSKDGLPESAPLDPAHEKVARSRRSVAVAKRAKEREAVQNAKKGAGRKRRQA